MGTILDSLIFNTISLNFIPLQQNFIHLQDRKYFWLMSLRIERKVLQKCWTYCPLNCFSCVKWGYLCTQESVNFSLKNNSQLMQRISYLYFGYLCYKAMQQEVTKRKSYNFCIKSMWAISVWEIRRWCLISDSTVIKIIEAKLEGEKKL